MYNKRLVKIKVVDSNIAKILDHFGLNSQEDYRTIKIEIPDTADSYKYLSSTSFIEDWEFIDEKPNAESTVNIPKEGWDLEKESIVKQILLFLTSPTIQNTKVEQVRLTFAILYLAKIKNPGMRLTERVVNNAIAILQTTPDKYEMDVNVASGFESFVPGAIVSLIVDLVKRNWNRFSVQTSFQDFIGKMLK